MEVIQGLHTDVLGSEVAEIANVQVRYHEARSAFYATQAKLLGDAVESAGKTSMDPASNMRQKAVDHENKANHLRFVAAHIKADATYRLGAIDMETLGITRSRY